jgi:hypothetical protein
MPDPLSQDWRRRFLHRRAASHLRCDYAQTMIRRRPLDFSSVSFNTQLVLQAVKSLRGCPASRGSPARGLRYNRVSFHGN